MDLVCGEAEGTRAGYLRHWRRGDPACLKCKAAASEYQRLTEYHQNRIGLPREGAYRPAPVTDRVWDVLETDGGWLYWWEVVEAFEHRFGSHSAMGIKHALTRLEKAGRVEARVFRSELGDSLVYRAVDLEC